MGRDRDLYALKNTRFLLASLDMAVVRQFQLDVACLNGHLEYFLLFLGLCAIPRTAEHLGINRGGSVATTGHQSQIASSR